MLSRTVLLAFVVALFCVASVSAAPSWGDDSWSQEYESPSLDAESDFDLRHEEFIMAMGATAINGTNHSSTGVSSSTGSSVVYLPATMTVLLNTTTLHANFCSILIGRLNNTFKFLTPGSGRDITCATSPATYTAPSAPARLRRMLESTSINVTQLTLGFIPGNPQDSGAARLADNIAAQIECNHNTTCLFGIVSEEFPSLDEIGDELTTMAFLAIHGTLQVNNGQQANNGAVNNQVVAEGDSRKTNGGYYFLAAVLALFIVIAFVYFLVHKNTDPAHTDEAVKRRDELGMAPVVVAQPAAAQQGVVVQEDAPIAQQGQMDYRSVFALKHNVLDNKEEKAQEDEHNHNDVHFILHQ